MNKIVRLFLILSMACMVSGLCWAGDVQFFCIDGIRYQDISRLHIAIIQTVTTQKDRGMHYSWIASAGMYTLHIHAVAPAINGEGEIERCYFDANHPEHTDRKVVYENTRCVLGKMYAVIQFPTDQIFSGDYADIQVMSGKDQFLDIPLFQLTQTGKIIPRKCEPNQKPAFGEKP